MTSNLLALKEKYNSRKIGERVQTDDLLTITNNWRCEGKNRVC
jgi:hypothetical protein